MAKESNYANRINESDNFGGWKESEICAYCNGDLYNGLPADLKAVIKTVNKLSDNGFDRSPYSWGGELVTTQDKIWIPSVTEIGVPPDPSDITFAYVIIYALAGQGPQYAVYTDDDSRIVNYDGSVQGDEYWLRSAYGDVNDGFCCIDIHDGYSCNYVGSESCVVAGFCI